MKPEEALEQMAYLRDLVASSRIRVAEGYPHLIWWGLLYAVAYTATALASLTIVPWIWFGFGTVGALGSLIIGRLTTKSHRGATPALLKQLGWTTFAISAAATVILCLFIPIQSHSLRLLSAYWPFVIGIIYAVDGLFLGRELTWTGCWLVLAALASLWLDGTNQLIWLAAAGGGGLIASGLILRRELIHRA
jgi:hypothetical protein